MRRFAVPFMIVLAVPAFAETPEAPTDREAKRQTWHRCVRQAFSGQSPALDAKTAQRAALAACKRDEDAYVAAEFAARQAEDESRRAPGRGFTVRVREWVSSAAAVVVDPVASWIGGLVR